MRPVSWNVVLAGSVALACLLTPGAPASAAENGDDLLATVRITDSVLAGGQPLPAGTYQVRLTSERPISPDGHPAAQQGVEFVAGGVVVAREVAEVLRDDDLPAVGASAQAAKIGTRVERLRGDEFVRISVKREGVRYLVHLPLVR